MFNGVNSNSKHMENLIKRIGWWFDYYIVYFLYNPKKRHRYHKEMFHKYGKIYGRPLPKTKKTSPYDDLEKKRRGRSKY